MFGIVVISITVFVIWLLGKVFTEKPREAAKQDAWNRFKRQFRAGRIYHYLAARNRERLKEMYILYLLVGILMLCSISAFYGLNKPELQLSDMNQIQGELVQTQYIRLGCKSEIGIKTQQQVLHFTACLTVEDEKRLHNIIGQPVTAWVAEDRNLFEATSNSIEQIQYKNELIIDYQIKKSNHNNFKENGTWMYFVILPFIASILFLYLIVSTNIREYGLFKKH